MAYEGKYSEIQLGLCSSDDTANFHYDLLEFWRLKCKIFHSYRVEFVPLTLPLMRFSKQEILFYLPESLKKMVWYCAMPNINVYESDPEKAFTPCGVCTKCLDHQLALKLSDPEQINLRNDRLFQTAGLAKSWKDGVREKLLNGDPYAYVLNTPTVDDVVEVKDLNDQTDTRTG